MFGKRVERKRASAPEQAEISGQLDGFIGGFVELAKLSSDPVSFKNDPMVQNAVKNIMEAAAIDRIGPNVIEARIQSLARKEIDANPNNNNNVAAPLINNVAALAGYYRSVATNDTNTKTNTNADKVEGKYDQQQKVLADLMAALDAAKPEDAVVKEPQSISPPATPPLSRREEPNKKEAAEAALDKFLIQDEVEHQEAVLKIMEHAAPNLSDSEKDVILSQARIDAGLGTLADMNHFEARAPEANRQKSNPITDLRITLSIIVPSTKMDTQSLTSLSANLKSLDTEKSYTFLKNFAQNTGDKAAKHTVKNIEQLQRLVSRAENATTKVGASLINIQITRHLKSMANDATITNVLKDIDPKVAQEKSSGMRPK